MPTPHSSFGLRKLIWFSDRASKCANSKCGKSLSNGTEFYYDTDKEADYCFQCGVCLRYHRKKAVERGEPAPAGFADIDEEAPR